MAIEKHRKLFIIFLLKYIASLNMSVKFSLKMITYLNYACRNIIATYESQLSTRGAKYTHYLLLQVDNFLFLCKSNAWQEEKVCFCHDNIPTYFVIF